MRGWSCPCALWCFRLPICPAYAGVILLIRFMYSDCFDLSRVCGGDPFPAPSDLSNPQFVPRMRGWSRQRKEKWKNERICPAYAGVILRWAQQGLSMMHLSRVCGGDPAIVFMTKDFLKFVPRMRGWFFTRRPCAGLFYICPAYAGVIPLLEKTPNEEFHLSRVCGGDPSLISHEEFIDAFVPPMRGWSHRGFFHLQVLLICPAYAGMIPLVLVQFAISFYLSRVCGDDPIIRGRGILHF